VSADSPASVRLAHVVSRIEAIGRTAPRFARETGEICEDLRAIARDLAHALPDKPAPPVAPGWLRRVCPTCAATFDQPKVSRRLVRQGRTPWSACPQVATTSSR